jgi:pSer/pThr/pTyr-binding forkhead associated (FHA) protein
LRPITAIGRAENNPIVVDDPFASAHHAIIIWREDHWWLEDLDSHNGTYLNEARVTQPATLASGDRIRIGQTVLRFERATLDESLRSATH